jgi:hypothetical protein
MSDLRTFRRDQVGRKFHVEYPVMKHVENSTQGIKRAKRHHCKTIDLDILPDEDLLQFIELGRPLTIDMVGDHSHFTHWLDPFRRDDFRDPKRILHKGDHMTEMNGHEISRIVAGHRPNLFHIPTINEGLALCGEVNIQALVEPKRGNVKCDLVFMRDDYWALVAQIAIRHNTRIAAYTLAHKYVPHIRSSGINAWGI